MGTLTIKDIEAYVEHNIGEFHQRRLQKLEGLTLNKVLARKNPYLFKAKNILTAQDLVKTILDAFLSSQEETIFGDFLEGLSIYICEKVYDGKKSVAEGIDLEFDKDGIRYIVTIKSGPNWGNSSQIQRMLDNFRRAKKIVNTTRSKKNIIAINGCCYGKEMNPNKGEYLKICGQAYWEFISGNSDLYLQIIEPLGHKAKEKNEEFLKAYSILINKFTTDFCRDFCNDGEIDWEKIVRLTSEPK